jgi:hypothetical protein
MAGCIHDKRWFLTIGNRNCGKGIITDLLIYCFGKFVNTFDTSNLEYHSHKPTDAKSFSWLVDKKDARLNIGNEIVKLDEEIEKKKKEEPIYNSKIMKQLVSGGDIIEARKNFKDEITFRGNSTYIIYANDMIKFTTKDALDNCAITQLKSQFVYKDELMEESNFYKLRDDSLKTYIQEPDVKDAFTFIILNSFYDEVPIIPTSIKIDTNIICDKNEEMPIDKFIIKFFKTTNNKEDRLTIEELNDILAENGYKSHKPITTLLNKHSKGIECKNCKRVAGKYERGFNYICYTKQDEDA